MGLHLLCRKDAMQTAVCSEQNVAGIGAQHVSCAQDVIKKSVRNKPREVCVRQARTALQAGQSVLMDRCNFDADQRKDFVALAKELSLQVEALPVFQRSVMYTTYRSLVLSVCMTCALLLPEPNSLKYICLCGPCLCGPCKELEAHRFSMDEQH